jgi:phage FluMu protein Com
MSLSWYKDKSAMTRRVIKVIKSGGTRYLYFFCPKCKEMHSIEVKLDPKVDINSHSRYDHDPQAAWRWNGSKSMPLVCPCVHIHSNVESRKTGSHACRFFLTPDCISYMRISGYSDRVNYVPVRDWPRHFRKALIRRKPKAQK